MAAAPRPPGPRSVVPGRLAYVFGRDRLRFLEEMVRRYGDVVFFRIALQRFAILNHPEYVRDILVARQRMFHKGIGLKRTSLLLGKGLLTAEDDHHLRQRRMLQPAFHRDRIEAYGAAMVAAAARHSDRWRDDQAFDVQQAMAAIAITIAGTTLFGADIEDEAATIMSSLTAAIGSFEFVLLPFGEQLARLPVPPAIRFRRARATLDATVYRLVAERRAGRGGGTDLLSMLVAARDTEGDGAGMSDEQVRDEVITILLAGFETVSNALTWSWYLLAGDPAVEQRLHEELDCVLAGRRATAADVPRLRYTRAVVAELLRLYSPAYLIGRMALQPYPVPGTPYVLPAGTTVFLCEHLLHRDPRFWDDPGRFDPDRWLGASPPERHKFAYFPFGAGTRICIGEHFAWMEATLVLATVAQRWRLQLVPGQRVVPEPIITLRAKDGIRMTAHRRAAAVASAAG